jgi:hypothetical protein
MYFGQVAYYRMLAALDLKRANKAGAIAAVKEL